MRSARSRRRRISRVDLLKVDRADGLDEVEAAHEQLLKATAFVSMARELDQDKRWGERILALLECANKPVVDALQAIEKAIDAIIERHKRERQTHE